MTIETLPGEGQKYYLISYDTQGQERTDDPDGIDGLLSRLVEQKLHEEPITDVFFISHGWQGDVPAAKQQCNDWIGAMLRCKEDMERIQQVRPGFRPLLIGLHWPSLPWGDENLESAPVSFDTQADPLETLVDDAVDKIADTEQAREALRTIFAADLEGLNESALPEDVVAAYNVLFQEAGLATEGPEGAPGADVDAFDPEQVYQEAGADEDVSFCLPGLSTFLAPLRVLSFWKMKKRARIFGENGAAKLLRSLQQVTADRDVRFHLMGHSFGTIVVSAAVAGAGGDQPLLRPVHSLYLVQGALSLWAYCSDLPILPGKAGYFHSITSKNKVAGPIITTLSEHDTANKVFYPLGAGVADQMSYTLGDLPKYGASGCFGIQSHEAENHYMEMKSRHEAYDFQGGRIYNLDSAHIICNGGGVIGAHSDIAHSEVAHAFWEAVMVQEVGGGAEEGADDIFSFSGIDGSTGNPLFKERSAAEISKIAQGLKFDEDHLKDIRAKEFNRTDDGFEVRGNPLKISEVGWGVIFAHADNDKVAGWKEALNPLLELRRAQAGLLYKEYSGADGYRPNESKNKFLVRNGVGPGIVEPTKVPYYLLIVGDPETIPFRFQYQLDVQYAVGRIFFETPEEYAHYAQNVVKSEQGEFSRSAKAAFFGVQNRSDRSTQLSATELVKPLADWMAEETDWSVQTLLKEQAYKKDLLELLKSEDGPSLLFTASHGMGFPHGDSDQLPYQGALLCQDWPGPLQWRGKPIPKDFYFSADDVTEDLQLGGMINFHFACYGAGTPQKDDFAHRTMERKDIAPHSFVARLPQRLLSQPNGGVLAVVGHVERAWGCSFVWERAGKQLGVFQAAFERLLAGYPVGAAFEHFDERYAELSTMLTAELEEIGFGKVPDDLELARTWTANNDARSYVIIGDPAVRLPTSATGVEMPPAASVGIPSGDVSSLSEEQCLEHTVTVTVSSSSGEIKKEETWHGSLVIPNVGDEVQQNDYLATLHRKIAENAKQVWHDDPSVIPKSPDGKE